MKNTTTETNDSGTINRTYEQLPPPPRGPLTRIAVQSKSGTRQIRSSVQLDRGVIVLDSSDNKNLKHVCADLNVAEARALGEALINFADQICPF